MSHLPCLPFWVDAHESDTKHLCDAEQGRLLILLLLCWKSPKCEMPDNDLWLARKLARSEECIRTEFRPLIAEFFSCKRKMITQKRLRKEWNKAKERSKKAKHSANSRWQNKNNGCERNASEHVPSTASIPVSKPSTKPKKSIYRTLSSEVKKAFDQYWSIIPNKHDIDRAAESFSAALADGHKAEHIIKGAKRFADECSGKPKDKLPWPAQWLSSRSWENWVSAFERDPLAQERAQIGLWIERGTWLEKWGPKPMTAGCTISQQLIEQVCKDKGLSSPLERAGAA